MAHVLLVRRAESGERWESGQRLRADATPQRHGLKICRWSGWRDGDEDKDEEKPRTGDSQIRRLARYGGACPSRFDGIHGSCAAGTLPSL